MNKLSSFWVHFTLNEKGDHHCPLRGFDEIKNRSVRLVYGRQITFRILKLKEVLRVRVPVWYLNRYHTLKLMTRNPCSLWKAALNYGREKYLAKPFGTHVRSFVYIKVLISRIFSLVRITEEASSIQYGCKKKVNSCEQLPQL